MNDRNTNLKLVESSGNEKSAPPSSDGMLTHLRVSVIATIVLAAIVCGIYPLIVWGLSQAMFHEKANGSLIKDRAGHVVGSTLIGQSFSDPKYFQPRPSAAGSGYDATASGGSNLGPTSAKLLNGTTKPTTLPTKLASGEYAPGPAAVDYDGIKLRVLLYCQENNLAVEASQPLKAFADDKGVYDQAKLVTAFNDSDKPLTIKATTPVPADAVTTSASGLDPHISLRNAELQVPRVAAARKLPGAAVRKLLVDNTDGPGLGLLGDAGVNVLRLNVALNGAAKN